MARFCESRKDKPTTVRGVPIGDGRIVKHFVRDTGETKVRLLAFQLLPDDMPRAHPLPLNDPDLWD
jgi:hypothetical protein